MKNLIESIPKVSKTLPNGYGIKAKKQADKIISEGINDSAPKRKYVEGITIDDIESLDLDDGIWAEKRKDNGYSIFISIADPTEAIDPLSEIELEAINKATSIYSNTHIVHMLPVNLATDVISLNHNKKRLTKTIQIDYDDQMNISNTLIYESIFYNRNRFDYDSFSESISYEGKKFHSEINLMWEIARKLRAKRRDKANLDFYESDRKIINSYRDIVNKKYIASIIIEEFMVATNIATAKYTIKNNINSIFRSHMPEYKGKILKGESMQRAYYTTENKFHYGIGEEEYLHTTSPIRRIADYMLDRFLKAHIRNEETPYSKEEIRELVEYINIQINSMVILQKEHHFQSKLKSKTRKIRKRKKKIKCEIREIKDHLRNGIGNGLKLPEEVKQTIIEKIKNGKKGDWHWIITPYLVSKETEIIETLKKKVVGNTSPKIFFNILKSNIVERKKSCVFNIKESENDKEYEINIIYKGREILNKKSDIKNIEIAKIKIIEEIFNYFIENSKK